MVIAFTHAGGTVDDWVGLNGRVPSLQIGSRAYIENDSTGFWKAPPLYLFEYRGITNGSYVLHLAMADKDIYLPTSATGYTIVQRINGTIIWIDLSHIIANSDGSMSFDWRTSK